MLCPLVYKKDLSNKVSSKNRIKKNLGLKRSRVKKFGSKNIWVQIYFKIFGSLKILDQNFFWCNWIFDPKKFWIQKNSVQKFRVQNDLGPKSFSLKKLKWKQIFSKEKLGLKNNLVQKYWINKKFKSKRFLASPGLSLKLG